MLEESGQMSHPLERCLRDKSVKTISVMGEDFGGISKGKTHQDRM
jgi:hypothetical protein